MRNEILDRLVDNGTIQDYAYCNVSENGEENKQSKFRNTERLVLFFFTGDRLIIDTNCSGCSENSSLTFDI